jgi:hypothetical protein
MPAWPLLTGQLLTERAGEICHFTGGAQRRAPARFVLNQTPQEPPLLRL